MSQAVKHNSNALNVCCRLASTPTKASPSDGSYDLNDPEVLARIGNRVVKTVNKSNSEYLWISFIMSPDKTGD